MKKYEKLFKKSIENNIPVEFMYSSNKSPHFMGMENPDHNRICQPVVLGVKQWPNGKTGIYVRAYLMQKYSYSKNTHYQRGQNTKRYGPKKINWRLYNVAKMKKVRLVNDYPLDMRFYVNRRPEYNEFDKFFSKIIFAMKRDLSYSQYTSTNPYYSAQGQKDDGTQGVMESSQNINLRRKVEGYLKVYNLKYSKPIRIYAISENEEVGFLDSNYTWINKVWMEQVSQRNLIKGLKGLAR